MFRVATPSSFPILSRGIINKGIYSYIFKGKHKQDLLLRIRNSNTVVRRFASIRGSILGVEKLFLHHVRRNVLQIGRALFVAIRKLIT